MQQQPQRVTTTTGNKQKPAFRDCVNMLTPEQKTAHGKYHSEVRTIALEKYKTKSHEQRVIVELFGDVIMPGKTTAETTHPHPHHHHDGKRQHLSCTTRDNNGPMSHMIIPTNNITNNTKVPCAISQTASQWVQRFLKGSWSSVAIG